jgi:uncharacterized circularly permuted ATP-grasp superfamily protein
VLDNLAEVVVKKCTVPGLQDADPARPSRREIAEFHQVQANPDNYIAQP